MGEGNAAEAICERRAVALSRPSVDLRCIEECLGRLQRDYAAAWVLVSILGGRSSARGYWNAPR